MYERSTGLASVCGPMMAPPTSPPADTVRVRLEEAQKNILAAIENGHRMHSSLRVPAPSVDPRVAAAAERDGSLIGLADQLIRDASYLRDLTAEIAATLG